MMSLPRHLVLVVMTVGLVLFTVPASAQDRIEEAPPELEGLGIFERNGDALPLELTFTDSQGAAVKLGDYFQGEKPVILTLVYYDCPMLCNILLDGFVNIHRLVDEWLDEERGPRIRLATRRG